MTFGKIFSLVQDDKIFVVVISSEREKCVFNLEIMVEKRDASLPLSMTSCKIISYRHKENKK